MCCFTEAVSVSTTSIFARDAGDGRQYLAYEMKFATQKEVAMVLPLPVAPGSGENAVTFIDLTSYPDLFTDLFLTIGFKGKREHTPAAPDAEAPKAALEVHQVGSFEASFVPTVKDFARLDQRFRFPQAVWDALPGYRDFGFAVFKLKPGVALTHPMAFSFPRADGAGLFFPTVHIHDGAVHPQADFDHFLYAQVGNGRIPPAEIREWSESGLLAGGKVDLKRSAGMVAGDQHVYCRQLKGKLPNQDTYLKTT